MRAFILMMAAASLAIVIGCENQNNDRELAAAPASAPRVNLYPLTSPPPGSVQPLQGYAPTRISATQYGPEVYVDQGGNAEMASRTAMGIDGVVYATVPGPATPVAPAAPAAAFADPNAAQTTYAAATYPAGMTYQTAAYQGGFATQPASFGVGAPAIAATAAPAGAAASNDPNSPYYCPPGAAFCPTPGYPGVSGSAAPGDPFGVAAPVQTTTVYASAPAVAATTPVYQTAAYAPPATTYAATTTSYQTAGYTAPATTAYQTAGYVPPATTTYRTTTTAAYTPPTIPPAAAPATTPASYAPPRLSATAAYAPPAPAYTPPAYTPPPARPAPRPAAPAPSMAYQSPYQNQAPVGLHFGAVEGTADIVGPLPSLNPVVRPGPGAYSAPGYQTAPVYGSPYARPLSMNTVNAVGVEAAPAAPVPAMASLPPPAPAGRPLLLSSAARPAIGGRRQEPVSAVAGATASAADRGGYRLIPAPDVPPGNHPNDFGPSQWFEVVRPGNGAVRIGRISATCVCVGARIPKRHYAAGERILVEARMLAKPSVNNVTYGLYVNIAEPVETVVDADVTLRY